MNYCKICGNIGHKSGLCTTDTVEINYTSPDSCKTVELFTSLDRWMIGDEMTQNPHTETFVINKGFPVGKHFFKFRIDKTIWKTSPDYRIEENQGIQNNFITVNLKNGESVIVKSNITKSSIEKNEEIVLDIRILLNEISLREMQERNNFLISPLNQIIEVWGSWNNWQSGEKMDEHFDQNANYTVYVLKKHLERKIYYYKFKINNEWVIDPYRESQQIDGILNHVLNFDNEINFDFKELKKGLIVSNMITTTVYFHEKLRDFDLVGHSLTTVGGKLFMFGGKDRDSFTNNIFRIEFNPFKVKLMEVFDPNGPSPIGFHKVLKYGEKLIIYGGHNHKRVSDSYHTYSTLKNTWTVYKFEKPLVRELYSVVYKRFTSRIYIFGGLYCSPDDEAELHFNDLHVLFLNMMKFKLLKTENAPCGRYGHSAELINWTMFVFGGCRNDGMRKICFNDLYKINLFDHEKLVWEQIQSEGPRPSPRYAHLCVQFGTQLIIYGGYNDKMLNNLLGDFWIYEIIKNTWIQMQFQNNNLDYSRAFAAGTMLNNSLIVFGGKMGKKNQLVDKFLKFDFEF